MLREKLKKLTISEIKGIIKSYNYHTKIIMTGRKKEQLIDDLIKHLETDIIQNKVRTVIKLEGENKKVKEEMKERETKKTERNKVKTEMRLYEENVKVNKEMKEMKEKRGKRKQMKDSILSDKPTEQPQKKTDEQPEIDFIEYMQMASQFRALPYEELLKLKLKVKNSEKVSEKNREIIMMLVEDIISEKKPKQLKEKEEDEKGKDNIITKSLKKITSYFTGKQEKVMEDMDDEEIKKFKELLEYYKYDEPARRFYFGKSFEIRNFFIYILQKHKNVGFTINKDASDEEMIGWTYHSMRPTVKKGQKKKLNGYIQTNYYKFSEKEQIKKIEEDIEKNKKAGKRFIAIPLKLASINMIEGHQNMIILDLEKKTAERFEPHGERTYDLDDEENDLINELLKQKFEKELHEPYRYKYITPSEICPLFTKDFFNEVNEINKEYQKYEGKKLGLQMFENLILYEGDKSEGGGYCIMWSLYYLESRLTAPNYTPAELHKIMFKKFNTDPHEFLKFIRGYAKFFGEFQKKLNDDFIKENPKFQDVLKKIKKGKKLTDEEDKMYDLYRKEYNEYITDMLNKQ
jgi:hypothetical protein